MCVMLILKLTSSMIACFSLTFQIYTFHLKLQSCGVSATHAFWFLFVYVSYERLTAHERALVTATKGTVLLAPLRVHCF